MLEDPYEYQPPQAGSRFWTWTLIFWLFVIGIVGAGLMILLAGCISPQERMKYCNEQAGALKGDARKAFMSECLKA